MRPSARSMLEALIAGVSDSHKLAQLARGHLKAKHEQLVKALQGRFTAHHAFAVNASRLPASGDGEGEGVDGAGAGGYCCLGAGLQRGAGGVDVVNQEQGMAGHTAGCGEGAGHVLLAFGCAQADLPACILGALQPGGFQGEARSPTQPCGQKLGLVVAAFLVAPGVEWDGHDGINGLGQGIPRGGAEDGDEVAREGGGQLRAVFIL